MPSAGARASTCSATIANIYESRQALRDGVTQAPTAAVPQFAHLTPIARASGYGVALNPITIIYDRRKAKTPVTSWRDLWNPEWRHRTRLAGLSLVRGRGGLC